MLRLLFMGPGFQKLIDRFGLHKENLACLFVVLGLRPKTWRVLILL